MEHYLHREVRHNLVRRRGKPGRKDRQAIEDLLLIGDATGLSITDSLVESTKETRRDEEGNARQRYALTKHFVLPIFKAPLDAIP